MKVSERIRDYVYGSAFERVLFGAMGLEGIDARDIYLKSNFDLYGIIAKLYDRSCYLDLMEGHTEVSAPDTLHSGKLGLEQHSTSIQTKTVMYSSAVPDTKEEWLLYGALKTNNVQRNQLHALGYERTREWWVYNPYLDMHVKTASRDGERTALHIRDEKGNLRYTEIREDTYPPNHANFPNTLPDDTTPVIHYHDRMGKAISQDMVLNDTFATNAEELVVRDPVTGNIIEEIDDTGTYSVYTYNHLGLMTERRYINNPKSSGVANLVNGFISDSTIIEHANKEHMEYYSDGRMKRLVSIRDSEVIADTLFTHNPAYRVVGTMTIPGHLAVNYSLKN